MFNRSTFDMQLAQYRSNEGRYEFEIGVGLKLVSSIRVHSELVAVNYTLAHCLFTLLWVYSAEDQRFVLAGFVPSQDPELDDLLGEAFHNATWADDPTLDTYELWYYLGHKFNSLDAAEVASL